jgi:Zn-dependent protease with chaperone function
MAQGTTGIPEKESVSSVGNRIRKDLAKVVAFALLSLFLVPVATLLFVNHAQPQLDGAIIRSVERQVDQDKRISAEGKVQIKAFYRANPASSLCASTDPELAQDQQALCPRFSDAWQFHTAHEIARWTILAGVVVLLAELLLGAVAFWNRKAQYLSFVIGWRMLSLASAVEMLVQGAMLVWLSFWVTAFFFHLYSIKLIAMIGILVAAAVFFAIVGLLRRPALANAIDGELVGEGDAPGLWANTRALAARLKTAPPRQIVAGIDTNFFVTEAPLTVAGKTLIGRTLFVSLPLLRLLDRAQADAVLGHELAHFRGGDAASSARLGPKLVQYDHYLGMMRGGGLTLVVYHLMYLYRMIFEFALMRDSREREFKADRTAAKLVSPQAIVQSLIKIAAYASYRSEIERELFEHDRQHSEQLGIAQFVASGLAPYAASAKFVQAMGSASVPHPFDSHPAMLDRMKNVRHLVKPDGFGAIVTEPVARSWADDIQTAPQIEQRLWTAYEQGFAADHERTLAYRYVPDNDTERALVLRYFPPQQFPLKGGLAVVVNYSGLQLPGRPDELSWDDIKNLAYENGFGGDVLTITLQEKGLLGAKTTKVKLPGIGKQREAFKNALGVYRHRHEVMRKLLAG